MDTWVNHRTFSRDHSNLKTFIDQSLKIYTVFAFICENFIFVNICEFDLTNSTFSGNI